MLDNPPTAAVTQPRDRLRDLINGYVWTQVLRAAARLRIADELATGPLTLDELATRTRVSPATLKRIMNGLAAIGVVSTAEDGRYRLTPLGEGLRADVPGSLADLAILSGEAYYRAWLGLDLTADDGMTPFARAHGAPLFDWLSQHPETGARFNRRMATRVGAFAATAAAAEDLSSARTIVDIGGGLGVMLEAFLRQWPRARGVLFDLPGAAAAGKERLAATGLAGRVDVVGGNFFDSVTAGGDVYILSQILHDWDEARSLAILTNIRRAIDPTGRLLIIEALMPEQIDSPHPAVELDLIMLVITGGQERTAAEYRALLERAGFALEQVHAGIGPGGIAMLVARPV